MKIFDPKLTGSIEILNTITGDVTLTGNLNVDGALGGAVTGSATASYVDYDNIDSKPTLISGSAQIATDISGSSTSLSSSIASELLKNTTDTLTGDLTVTGTLTAQDLHVQEVTSSIVFSSGSNKFGALSTDTQEFTGSLQVSGSIDLEDSVKLNIGTGNDLQIYHDGSNSYINESGTGVLTLQSDGTEVQINKGASEYMGRFIADAGVKLYYDNSLKFETLTTGVKVTGNITTNNIYANSGNSYNIGHAGTMFNAGYFLELTAVTSLSAGTGTFTGNVSATNILTVAGAATGSPFLQFTQGGTQKAYIQYLDSSDSFELQSDNQFVVRTGGSTIGLTINSSQNATFAGTISSSTISAEGMITVTQSDIGNGEGVGLQIIRSGGAQVWNITSGLTGADNTTFNVRNSTSNTNVFSINASSNNATFTGTITSTSTSTNTLAGKLRINGTTTTGLEIASSSGSSSGLKLYNDSSNDHAYILNHYNGNLVLGTNNAAVITLNGTNSTFAGSIFLPDNRDIGWGGGFSSSKPTLAANGTTMKMYPSGNAASAQFTLSPTQATFRGEILNAMAAPKIRLQPTTQNNASILELGVLNGGTNAYARIDAINLQNFDTNLRFWTNAPGSTAQVQRMVINSSGNVGIGTPSPDQTGYGYKTLTIMGGTSAGYAGVLELLTPSTSANGQNLGIISFGSGGTRNAMIGAVRQSGNNNGKMEFWTSAGANGIEKRMVIDADGRVGIGISNPGVYGLHANNASNSVYFKSTSGSVETLYGGATAYAAGLLGTTSNHPLLIYANNAEHMRITSDGNVGVRMTSPTASLGIRANYTANGGYTNSNWARYIILDAENTGGGGIIWTKQSSTYNRAILNNQGKMEFGRSTANDSSAAWISDFSIDAVGDSTFGGNIFIASTSDGIFLGGTSNANKLDDYEEGTWTPVISHNDGTGVIPIVIDSARYVKVGDLVYISAWLSDINTGGGGHANTGAYYGIRGMPFTPENYGIWELAYASSGVTAYGGYSSSASLYFMHNGTNGQRSSTHVNGAAVNAWGANQHFMFNCTYRVQ